MGFVWLKFFAIIPCGGHIGKRFRKSVCDIGNICDFFIANLPVLTSAGDRLPEILLIMFQTL